MVRAAPAPRSVRQWCREPVYKFDPEPLRTPHCRHARKGRSTHSRLPPPGLRAGAADEEAMMEILYPRCAGLDIHRDSIVACVRLADSRIERHVESFGTTTTELERLSGLALQLSGHARGHGSHRRVLEAGLGGAGRRL